MALPLPQQETKSLVSLHGWTAVLLGLLLYAVVVTGAVAVFADEIEQWSVGLVETRPVLAAGIDAPARRLAATVEPEHLDEVTLSSSPQGQLKLFFHTHRQDAGGQIEEYGDEFVVNPETGELIAARTGTAVDLFYSEPLGALARFIVSIHTELHLPRPWGLLLTGILGLALLVSAVSGFLIHGHLFKEAFLLRRGRSDLLHKRDIHTLAGTWGLPFAFVLAFTGSFFSFAGAFGIPAMAMVAFGGDQELMIRTLVDQPALESELPGPTANLDRIVADAAARGGEAPSFLSVTGWDQDGARVTVFTPPPEGALNGMQFAYDGNTGEFQRSKPPLGKVPSAGSTAVSLMGPLHFGHFAGLISKLVWGALGFAVCYVVITGFTLWLKRREQSSGWHWLSRSVVSVSLGIPLAMLGCALAYFLARGAGADPAWWVPASFVATALAVILYGFLARSVARLNRDLLLLTAVLSAALPGARLATAGPSWSAALVQGNLAVPALDITMLCIAGFAVLLWQRKGNAEQLLEHQLKLSGTARLEAKS